MTIWQTLGIDPTNDLQKIKNAYSAQLILHHPEEDPAGFEQLRNAYKMASKNAHSQTSYSSVASSAANKPVSDTDTLFTFTEISTPPSPSTPINKKPSPSFPNQNPPLNFSHLEINSPSNAPPPEENIKEDIVDFAALASDYPEYLKQQEAMADSLFDAIRGVFYNPKKIKSASEWQALFSRTDFQKLCANPQFSSRFLFFFYNEQQVPPKVWNKVFIPLLEDWACLYPNSPLSVDLLNAKHFADEKQNKITAQKKSTFKNVVGMVLLGLIGIYFFILSSSPSSVYTKPKEPPVPAYQVTIPKNQINSLLNPTTPFSVDITTLSIVPLPLTQQDLYNLTTEQQHRDFLQAHLLAGGSCAEAETQANALGLTPAQQEELDILAQESDPQSIETYLQPFRPYENFLLQATILPAFRAELVNSNYYRCKYFCNALGLSEQDFYNLLLGSAKYGNDWLVEETDSYHQFALPPEELANLIQNSSSSQ